MDFESGLARIDALQIVRKEIAELKELELRLSTPLLSNYKDIPKVLNLFLEITGAKAVTGTWEAVGLRKKFIFVTIFLFAPCTILGNCMPKRLRTELGRSLGLKAVSAVSNNWTEALFYYRQYPDFRNDVDRITNKILARLNLG